MTNRPIRMILTDDELSLRRSWGTPRAAVRRLGQRRDYAREGDEDPVLVEINRAHLRHVIGSQLELYDAGDHRRIWFAAFLELWT